LSGKEKVERDYHELEECVEGLAKEEIEKIRKRMEALKLEAAKVGETVEAELAETEKETGKKKS
jgi:phosphopentomutase